MKKVYCLLLLAALLLTGCGQAAQDPHPEWGADWVRVGNHIGVEPVEGFVLSEQNDVLSLSGMYYAAWANGQGRAYTNDEGKEATVYDGQIYMLLMECRDEQEAARELASWMAREGTSYQTGEKTAKTFGDQSFDLIPLLSGGGTNPYTHGAAAFARRGKWAISVELVCTDGFAEEPQEILTRFLSGLHYGE